MAEVERKASEPLRKSGSSTARTALTDRPTSRLVSVEREHEASLVQAYDRLQLSENTHEREVQTLKAHLALLRQDLSATLSSNARDLSELRTQLQARVEAEQKLREAEVLGSSSLLRESQHTWANEADRAAELRRELLSLKAKRADETGRLQGAQRKLAQELESVRQQHLARLQHDVDRARAEKTRLLDQQERTSALLRQEQQSSLSQLNTQLAERECLVRRLEAETEALRDDLQKVMRRGEEEMEGLQASVGKLRRLAELQDRDFAELEQSRRQARNDAREMSTEVRKLEQEMKRMHSENQFLRSSSGKLGKLVYGRTKAAI